MRNCFWKGPVVGFCLLGVLLGVGCTPKSSKKIFGYAAVASPAQIRNFRVLNDGTLDSLAPAAFGLASQPSNIVAHPNGKFLYVTSYNGSSLYMLAIAEDGSLSNLPGSPLGVTDAATGPEAITISRDGKYVYTSSNISSVAQFTVQVDGTLLAMAPATVSASGPVTDVEISPNGLFAYAVTTGGTVNQYSVGATGGLTPLTPATVATSLGATDFSISPGGGYAYVISTAGIRQYSIGVDGKLTALVPGLVAQAGGANASVITLNGQFMYVVNASTNAPDQLLYGYSIGIDGKLVALPTGPYPVGLTAYKIDIDSTGRYIFVSNFLSGSISSFTIKSSGELLPFVGTTPVAMPLGISTVFR